MSGKNTGFSSIFIFQQKLKDGKSFSPISEENRMNRNKKILVCFFTRYSLIELTPTSAVPMSEFQFFSSNCSKFSGECDWNSKISQNVQILGFFEKSRWFFRKKMIFFSISLNVTNFFKNAFQMILLLKNVFSALVMRFFRQKSKNFERWKN